MAIPHSTVNGKRPSDEADDHKRQNRDRQVCHNLKLLEQIPVTETERKALEGNPQAEAIALAP